MKPKIVFLHGSGTNANIFQLRAYHPASPRRLTSPTSTQPNLNPTQPQPISIYYVTQSS